MSQPKLSIIIPAHNEADRLPQTLEKIQNFLKTYPEDVQVIVVENASQDSTAEIVRNAQLNFPQLQLLSFTEPGKGYAVRQGMLAADGDYRFMADADLSMSIDQITKFLPPSLQDTEVAIASREVKGSKRIGEPFSRHIVGRVFNWLVQLIVLPGIQDSQCGFKCFSAKAAEAIFSRQTENGWSFDVETLAIARDRGFIIKEVPVIWVYSPGSRLSVLRDSWRMASDLFKIRRKSRAGLFRA